MTAFLATAPLVDFRAPATPKLIDTSASACAACGLLEIATYVPALERKLYVDAAVQMLQAIDAAHTNWDPETDGIVLDVTPAYHDDTDKLQQPIIYADYYFIEAILRLRQQAFLLW